MEVRAEALFPMDFGDSTFTSFEANTSYFDAFDQFPEVDPIKKEPNSHWFIGKIHSHHNMSAFHSATDTTDLYENAPKLPFFLSLVVNYSCKPFAEIAVYGETKEKVVTNTRWKLRDFRGGGKDNKIAVTMSPTCLVVPCDVAYEEEEWLGKQIKVIEEAAKKAAALTVTTYNGYSGYNNHYKNYEFEGEKNVVEDIPAKVYSRILGGLTDLITLGAQPRGAAYNAMNDISKHITSSIKPKYIAKFCEYFEDDWYLTNFYNVSTTPGEVVKGIEKFLALHPSNWITNVLLDATKQLRSNLAGVQSVQGPSMVPTNSRK